MILEKKMTQAELNILDAYMQIGEIADQVGIEHAIAILGATREEVETGLDVFEGVIKIREYQQLLSN